MANQQDGAQGAQNKPATAKFGVYQGVDDVSGMTVKQVVEAKRAQWNLPRNEQLTVKINKQEVGLDRVIAAGETVHFIRRTGEKG